MRSQVIGYEVFYSMAAVEDLDQWERKTVGLVTSIDLVNLERHAQVSSYMFSPKNVVFILNAYCITRLLLHSRVSYFLYYRLPFVRTICL